MRSGTRPGRSAIPTPPPASPSATAYRSCCGATARHRPTAWATSGSRKRATKPSIRPATTSSRKKIGDTCRCHGCRQRRVTARSVKVGPQYGPRHAAERPPRGSRVVPSLGYRRAVVVSLSPPHAAARDRRRGSPGPSPETCRGRARPTLRVAGSGRGPWLLVRRPAWTRDRWTPQRSSWMRIRLPAGSRKAQSRMPYGCSVGSWTTSAPLASSRAKVPSRSLVARRIQP